MTFRAPFRALAAALVLLTAAPSALAQDDDRRERMTYEDQLAELSLVLGRAHYLRITCNGRSDDRWRTYVRHMLQREPEHRRLITDSFNDGYRMEEARFPFCDRGALQMESELRAQGLRLAQGLSVRNAGDGAPPR